MTRGLRVLALLASAGAWASQPAPAAERRWMDLERPDRDRELARLAGLPHRERLLEISRRFLGTPYLASPLGEGEGRDPDPLLRYDAVDCLTFVEQSLAMSRVSSEEGLLPVLAAVRYFAAPRYESRNHLMEAQWLPHNVQAGIIAPLTSRHGGPDVQRTRTRIVPATWRSASSRALGLPEQARPTGIYPLELLPLDRVMARARDIPSGTILLLVREDHPGKVTRVTHLGFVVQKRRRAVLRHAARNHFGRVVDEDLETFLTRNARYQAWRVAGVALFSPLSPSSALEARASEAGR